MPATAPYNFVPASETVLFPPWAELVSHDVPFRDGLCGYLEVEIEAQTPLFIRGNDAEGAFFRTPDDDPALPGSSLRGMLRNVVQIASFGKLGPVNDRKLSFRDLHNDDYRRRMADRGTPLVSAGWLEAHPTEVYDGPGEEPGPRWGVQPCNFAKIEYKLLQTKYPGFNPGRKRQAHEKYRDTALRGRSLEVSCTVKLLADAASRRGGASRAVGSYGEVTSIESGHQGVLVFTGQPQEYEVGMSRRKHHDFFFYGSAGAAIPVPFSVRRDFSQIHSNGGEQHRLDSDANPDWNYWLERLRRGERVPVFFLLDGAGQLEAIGLAMMFRLPCDTTTKQAVLNAQPLANDPRPDLAELIFGRVSRSGGATMALRGRASLEAAVPVGPISVLPEVAGVLGAPRASYYPNYLETRSGGGQRAYATYRDKAAKARGWKRFPTRDREVSLPQAPRNAAGEINERVGTRFRPIDRGARFIARLNVHNLRRVELGALLWAIDFGGRAECRHSLGLARPYGYGAITIRVTSSRLRPNDWRDFSDRPEEWVALRDEFRAYMEREVRAGWEGSEQIFQLLTMARVPATQAQADKLEPMQLDPSRRPNAFEANKSDASNALPRYGDASALAAHRGEVSSPPVPLFLPPPAAPERGGPGSSSAVSAPHRVERGAAGAGTDAVERSEFELRLGLIKSLGAKITGQAQPHLEWFDGLTVAEERRRAARALVTAATPRWVKKKVKQGSAPWAAVFAAADEGHD